MEKQMKTAVFQLGGHPVWFLPADCPQGHEERLFGRGGSVLFL